jgi:hypothetical protein
VATGASPINAKADPRHKGEITEVDQVFRAFGGVNVTAPRQSIRDDQFAWLENAMPISPGNLAVTNAASYKGVTYVPTVLFETTANIGGVDYIFTFLSDGSATYIPDTTYVSTQFAAPATFTNPVAIAYASFSGTPGILIIDPVKGYWDFNVSAALTLTSLTYGLFSVSLATAPSITSQIQYRTFVSPVGAGSGGAITANLYLSSATIVAAGTGYSVGDVLSYTPGTVAYTTLPQITVATIGGGGTITGITLTSVGSIQLTAAGGQIVNGTPFPAPLSGGNGTGATANLFFSIASYVITASGNGYTTGATGGLQYFSGGTWHTFAFSTATLVTSGNLTGTTIAAYAGRVWVGSGKSLTYTDVSSYTYFGGAGGQLTISDSYLHNAITALASMGGFLYIFGDDSIDTLSNVQVTAGVTSFARVNITTSVGTSYPNSVFPYYRSLMFANKYGIYSLSGATPQKISDDLDGLFAPGVFVGGLVASSATIAGNLCMCWTFRIVDSFTTLYGTNTTRTLVVCFFKGKWFFTYPGFDVAFFTSIPANGTQTLHAFSTTGALYELFAANNTTILSLVRTKLWDGDSPMLDKEVILAAVGVLFSTSVNKALTVTTDNEKIAELVPAINAAVAPTSTYTLLMGAASTMGGKFYGMSVIGQQTDITYSLLAEQYRATTPW